MSKILQFIRKPRLPTCSICNKPVDRHDALIDPDGKTVHEECYVLKLLQKDAKKPPKTS
jgi:hypothetical protein